MSKHIKYICWIELRYVLNHTVCHRKKNVSAIYCVNTRTQVRQLNAYIVSSSLFRISFSVEFSNCLSPLITLCASFHFFSFLFFVSLGVRRLTDWLLKSKEYPWTSVRLCCIKKMMRSFADWSLTAVENLFVLHTAMHCVALILLNLISLWMNVYTITHAMCLMDMCVCAPYSRLYACRDRQRNMFSSNCQVVYFVFLFFDKFGFLFASLFLFFWSYDFVFFIVLRNVYFLFFPLREILWERSELWRWNQ